MFPKVKETCQETRQVHVRFDNDTMGLSTTFKTCDAPIPRFVVLTIQTARVIGLSAKMTYPDIYKQEELSLEVKKL
jgi:hypothetical protein